MAKDPVCGMEVDPDRSDWVMEQNGTNVYFCSDSYQTAFNRGPAYFSQVNQMGYNQKSMNREDVVVQEQPVDGGDTFGLPLWMHSFHLYFYDENDRGTTR
jgi:YHS domain-containing protein